MEANTLLTVPLFNAFPWCVENILTTYSSRRMDSRLNELHGKVIFVRWEEFLLKCKSAEQRQGDLQDLTAPLHVLAQYVGLKQSCLCAFT